MPGETHNHPSSLPPTTFTFGLITHPTRAGWPIHGCFIVENYLHRHGSIVVQNPGEKMALRDMFSVDACRDIIRQAIKAGDLDGDRAAELERQIIALGLPVAETRYDKISKALAKNPNYERLIGIFCGALPHEEGSGPARFESCEDGKHCGSEFCAEYPAHVVLVPEGITSSYGSLIFSREGAKTLLSHAVEVGILLPTDTDRLLPRTIGLSDSPEARRADKLCECQLDLVRELNVVFGFRRRDAPRFEANGDYYHLRIDGPANTDMPLKNEFDARRMIEGLMQDGFLSNEEQTKLLDDLAGLNLPPGSEEESLFNLANLARYVSDKLTNSLLTILNRNT
ncbi:MAG: hypothetical protein WC750_01165 [Patescibacteria group bacterium]|jgi:hypothetical protein